MSSILTPMQRLAVALGFKFDDGAYLEESPDFYDHVLKVADGRKKVISLWPFPARSEDEQEQAAMILRAMHLTPEQHARITRAEQAATLTARAEALRDEADRLIAQAEALESA